jgi:AraC-like DNA-binding protein
VFVSVLMVRILLDECRVRGVAAESLLAGTTLTNQQLADVRTRVPSELFAKLACRALRLTHDDGLGLSLGARIPVQALQVIGYLLSSAPTLRHAYGDFHRYASIVAENPTWMMREQGSSAHFEFNSAIDEPNTLRMANDWSVSLAYRIIAACAPDSDRDEISVAFSHPRPAYAARYAAVFERSVRFGQRRNAVIFPRAWLDAPQPHGDPGTCEGLREIAERLLSSVNRSKRLGDRVRVLLRQEAKLARIDVGALARKLGLSQSALRRRLASEGLSPSQLVDEARCRLARAELARIDTSIKQVADALGYAELRSFHRAFKRWTGKTPADYRAATLATAPPSTTS